MAAQPVDRVVCRVDGLTEALALARGIVCDDGREGALEGRPVIRYPTGPVGRLGKVPDAVPALVLLDEEPRQVQFLAIVFAQAAGRNLARQPCVAIWIRWHCRSPV